MIYGMKEINLNIEILEKIEETNTIRQIEEARKMIELEIKNLYEQKDKNKLKYLYYEYKKEKTDDISYIYESIMNDCHTKFNEDILKLYYIIKLSYHKV